MKMIALWQSIIGVVMLAVFFLGHAICGSHTAFVSTLLTFITFIFTIVTALSVTTDAIGAATVAIVATTAAFAVPNATTFAAIVVTVATFAVAALAADFKKKNRKIPFSQIIGSYVVEAAALYGIIAGFLHGMVLSVWLPTLITAIVSAILLGTIPMVRLRSKTRRGRLEKRASKLRIALEEEPPCSYRIPSETDETRELQAELEALEAELAALRAKAESLA